MQKVQLTVVKPTGEFSSQYHRYWEEMPCYLSVHDRDFRIIDGNRRFREDFANHQCANRRTAGRLEHKGTAHGQGRSDFVSRQVQWEVERRDE